MSTQATTGQRVIWAPNPGSQHLFLSTKVKEVLLEGTRGGGKTEALLMDFLQYVGRGWGTHWRGILFRNTYKQLEDVLVKSKRLFPRIIPGAVFKGGDQYKWVFPTGEELLFRQAKGIADYDNYHGHEYPWQGWEELTNWRNLDIYDAMKSCNRSSHPEVPRLIRATTNPLGVGHAAVKERFVDPAPWGTIIRDGGERVRIFSTFAENPHLWQNDPQYIEYLRNISDPNVRKAWLDGSWDIVAGGAVDDIFRSDIHITPELDIPQHWKVTRSFDWGSSRGQRYVSLNGMAHNRGI